MLRNVQRVSISVLSNVIIEFALYSPLIWQSVVVASTRKCLTTVILNHTFTIRDTILLNFKNTQPRII